MNNLDLCLEVVSRSRQPLRYIWRWISRYLLGRVSPTSIKLEPSSNLTLTSV